MQWVHMQDRSRCRGCEFKCGLNCGREGGDKSRPCLRKQQRGRHVQGDDMTCAGHGSLGSHGHHTHFSRLVTGPHITIIILFAHDTYFFSQVLSIPFQ